MTNGLLIGSPDWVREWRNMDVLERFREKFPSGLIEHGVEVQDQVINFIQSEITNSYKKGYEDGKFEGLNLLIKNIQNLEIEPMEKMRILFVLEAMLK